MYVVGERRLWDPSCAFSLLAKPTPESPRVGWVFVTPSMAAEALKNNKNRKIKERNVARCLTAIESKTWQQNGATATFYADGSLADGQHRLTAIARSQTCGQWMLVVWDLSREAGRTIDRGLRRSVADDLFIDGEGRSPTLAGALALLSRWKKNELSLSHGPKTDVSSADAAALLARHPGLRACCVEANLWRAIPAVACAFALHHADLCGFGKARQCLESVATGIGLTANSAAYHLHQRLLSHRRDRRARRSTDVLPLVLKAIRLHENNVPCRRLAFVEGESYPILGPYREEVCSSESH